MISYIVLAIYSVELILIKAKSDDVVISNLLSWQLCNNYDNSQYGRVLPEPSFSLSVCPSFEKAQNNTKWIFNNCGGNDGDVYKLSRRIRGIGQKTAAEDRGSTGGNFVNQTSKNKPGLQPTFGAQSGNQSSQTKSGQQGNFGDDYDDKIVNGRDAPPFTHPYLVYLRFPHRDKGLSGVIYNRYTIIVNTYHLQVNVKSAGKKDNLRIHIGKHKSQIRENEEEIRFMCNHTNHPKYTQGKQNSYYLYSAIHLYDPITISNYADKARLANLSQASSLEKNCLLPGWGDDKKPTTNKHTAETLQESDATVRDCVGNPVIDDNEFCTNPVYCWGDSGAPLMCTDKHRVFATGMASATGRKTTTKCKSSKDTIYADLKMQDLHDWAEKSFKDHKTMCRTLVRTELY